MHPIKIVKQARSLAIIFIWCAQLQKVYSVRSKAIQACMDETSANVSQLSAARDSNPSNRDEIVRQLRKEQTKVLVLIYSWYWHSIKSLYSETLIDLMYLFE